MRTYDICNDAGDVLRTVEEEDNFAPLVLTGETAKLTHIDGVEAKPGDAERKMAEEKSDVDELAPQPHEGTADHGGTTAHESYLATVAQEAKDSLHETT